MTRIHFNVILTALKKNVVHTNDISRIIPNLPFFRENFTEVQIKSIVDKVQNFGTEVFTRNQLIIKVILSLLIQKKITIFFSQKEGEEYKSIFIVLKGSVMKYNSDYSKVFNFGSILGLPYLLNRVKSKASTLIYI